VLADRLLNAPNVPLEPQIFGAQTLRRKVLYFYLFMFYAMFLLYLCFLLRSYSFFSFFCLSFLSRVLFSLFPFFSLSSLSSLSSLLSLFPFFSLLISLFYRALSITLPSFPSLEWLDRFRLVSVGSWICLVFA
jgi:hypothetical protein